MANPEAERLINEIAVEITKLEMKVTDTYLELINDLKTVKGSVDRLAGLLQQPPIFNNGSFVVPLSGG